MTTTTDSKNSVNASNVYLFKNGYGMIVKTFDFPPNKGNNDKPVELIDPPLNPIHGTFWIQSFSNNSTSFSRTYIYILIILFIYLASINSIRTKKTHKFVDKECFTVEDLLEANVGQDIQLLVTDSVTKSKEWISGKMKSFKRVQEQLSDDEDENVMNTAVSSAVVSTPFGE
jgi:hypothetical protein